MQTVYDKKVISEILKTHPEHDDLSLFYDGFGRGYRQEGSIHKKCTGKTKKSLCGKGLGFLQKRNIDETIGVR